jgi:hypothetical protein
MHPFSSVDTHISNQSISTAPTRTLLHSHRIHTFEQKGDTTDEGEETSDDETGERFLMRERAWGRAQRTIQLPDDAEIDKAKDSELKVYTYMCIYIHIHDDAYTCMNSVCISLTAACIISS